MYILVGWCLMFFVFNTKSDEFLLDSRSGSVVSWAYEWPVFNSGATCCLGSTKVGSLEVGKPLPWLLFLFDELAQGLWIRLNWSDGWWMDFALFSSNFIPVYCWEELVLFDLFSVMLGSQTFLWISIEEQKNDLTCIMGHRVRNFQRTLLDVFKKLRFRSVEIRRNSDKHFIDEYT